MKYFTSIAVVALTLVLSGSGVDASTDRKQARQTEKMVQAANQAVGMPNIVNFTEKRFAKLIQELRDQEVVTYSYFMDLQGRLHFLCESVGYGMPSSVQFVNPERVFRNGHGTGTLPQPEPNGLFMPEGLAATFVLCSDNKGGVRPVYSEPELIVSPFPLAHATSLQ